MMIVLYQLLLEDRDDGIRTEANKDSPIPLKNVKIKIEVTLHFTRGSRVPKRIT